MKSGRLHGIELDASDIPDMVPAFSVAAAAAEGRTVIKGAERLRIKECDRLAAMREGLSALGVDIKETDDGLIIEGTDKFHSAFINGFNDHRIVMMAALSAVICDGPVTIENSEAVRKSYPGFFVDYRNLGGEIEEYDR